MTSREPQTRVITPLHSAHPPRCLLCLCPGRRELGVAVATTRLALVGPFLKITPTDAFGAIAMRTSRRRRGAVAHPTPFAHPCHRACC